MSVAHQVTSIQALRDAEQEAEEKQLETILLKAQIKAQQENGKFLEDCIAEMAAQVYV